MEAILLSDTGAVSSSVRIAECGMQSIENVANVECYMPLDPRLWNEETAKWEDDSKSVVPSVSGAPKARVDDENPRSWSGHGFPRLTANAVGLSSGAAVIL